MKERRCKKQTRSTPAQPDRTPSLHTSSSKAQQWLSTIQRCSCLMARLWPRKNSRRDRPLRKRSTSEWKSLQHRVCSSSGATRALPPTSHRAHPSAEVRFEILYTVGTGVVGNGAGIRNTSSGCVLISSRREGPLSKADTTSIANLLLKPSELSYLSNTTPTLARLQVAQACGAVVDRRARQAEGRDRRETQEGQR